MTTDLAAEEKLHNDSTDQTNLKLKSLWVTLPQRDTPGTYPPLGPLAVMTRLKKEGFTDSSFYNIDLLRPGREEAIDYIVKYNPDLLCISAPTSTCYENCLFYSKEVKKRLPDCVIILGGNMAASAEVILFKTDVDFCVFGEGEEPAVQLFKRLAIDKTDRNLRDIKGLGYLNAGGTFVNTGYADQIPKEEIFEFDWNFLDVFNTQHCIPKIRDFIGKSAITQKFVFGKEGIVQEELLDYHAAMLPMSKGCVARCTFCHRFVKGIRFLPVELCIERIQYLMDHYNVRFFNFVDECFGGDVKWLRKFCEAVKPLNILWEAGGVRVKHMNRELIDLMKASGCRTIIYGMETGSERMIQIMEKRANIDDNVRAFKETLDAGLYTVPQLILGMPGENKETIRESAEFIASNMIMDKSQNPREVSINFAQALPGTPLYEYARHEGYIGKTIDEEERYLLDISDKDASDEETAINFTEYPQLTYLSWRNLILAIVFYRYVQHFGIKHYHNIIFEGRKPPSFWRLIKTKNFNLLLQVYPRFSYHTRFLMPLYKFLNIFIKKDKKLALNLLKEWCVMSVQRLWKRPKEFTYKSLRRIVEKDLSHPFEGSDEMLSLRKGR